jgi:flagellar biogenesis protein FliO
VTSQSLRQRRTLWTWLLVAALAATTAQQAAAAPAPLPEAVPSANTPSATSTPSAPLQFGRRDQSLKIGAPDTGNSIIWQSLTAVLVILLLGGLALYVVKRIGPRISQARGKKIRLMETFSLGPQKALFLVEVGSQRLLLGVSRDNVRLMADVTASVPSSTEGEGATRAKFVIPTTGAESSGAESGGRVAP